MKKRSHVNNKNKRAALKKALKHHGFLFLIAGIFLIGGLLLFFIGLKVVDQSEWFFILLGTCFIIPSLFILGTIPSSILHYYESDIIKKYSRSIEASIISLEVILSDPDKKAFVIQYSYIYDQKYESKDIIEDEVIFEKLSKNDHIPISVLSHKPQVSRIRIQKLKNILLN